MIFIAAIFAIFIIAIRIYRHEFTRLEAWLLALIAIVITSIAIQNIISNGNFPEKRYWNQALVLILPWAALGVMTLRLSVGKLVIKGRFVLLVICASILINNIVLMTRAHIPHANKQTRMAAIHWAKEIILNDYDGPHTDQVGYISAAEYHRRNRPIVKTAARFKRLPYEVGGRSDLSRFFGEIDIPDYAFEEVSDPIITKYADYELIAETTIDHRNFRLYRRRH